MAKVGSIKAYHNGAAYDVADIYDEKVSVGTSPTESVDSDSVIFYRSNVYGNFVCLGNYTSCQIQNYENSSVETHDVNGADAYFLHCATTSRVFFDFTKPDNSNGYTIDGIFYYPQNKFNRVQRLIEFGNWSINIKSYSTATLRCYCGSTSGDKTVNIDNNIFAQPFHFALVQTTNTISIYLNGTRVLSFGWAVRNATGTRITIANSATNSAASDMSCAFLRYSTRLHYTDNFTVNFADYVFCKNSKGYIPIRHDNQTYYVPLIAANNPPSLAVRHNNQTFYAVRS